MKTVFRAQAGKDARAFAGEVCGVCSHALYAFDGENILVLHDRAYGILPFGVAVDGIVDLLAALAPKEGERLTAAADILTCAGHKVELIPTVWHANRPAFILTPPDAERIGRVREILARRGAQNGIAALFAADTHGARTHADTLTRGMRQNDAKSAADAAVALLGLGRGLTPSGDDFVCGFFSLLLAARQSGISIPACTDAVCAAVIREVPARTSRISGAYVRAALGGRFFSIYDSAAAALLAKDADADALCDFVLAMGASSGADTLCGACFAAEILL